MRLIDDIFLDKSLSEESLSTDLEGVDLLNKKGKRQAKKRDDDVEPDDVFEFSKSL